MDAVRHTGPGRVTGHTPARGDAGQASPGRTHSAVGIHTRVLESSFQADHAAALGSSPSDTESRLTCRPRAGRGLHAAAGTQSPFAFRARENPHRAPCHEQAACVELRLPHLGWSSGDRNVTRGGRDGNYVMVLRKHPREGKDTHRLVFFFLIKKPSFEDMFLLI